MREMPSPGRHRVDFGGRFQPLSRSEIFNHHPLKGDTHFHPKCSRLPELLEAINSVVRPVTDRPGSKALYPPIHAIRHATSALHYTSNTISAHSVPIGRRRELSERHGRLSQVAFTSVRRGFRRCSRYRRGPGQAPGRIEWPQRFASCVAR